MSIVPVRDSQNRLPSEFTDADLNRLYQDTYTALSESFKTNPALGVMHHMMAERFAYIYVKSIEAGLGPRGARNRQADPMVERAYLETFTKLASELGKETRLQAREGAFKQALIAGVIIVLREELDNQPLLTQRIMQRLQEL